jgi:hypothetical protein
MRRYWTALVCTALLAVAALALNADESTSLSIEPSEMKDGETKTFTDDGRSRTITVRRQGNSTEIRIDGADKTDRVTITREGNRIHIGRLDSEGGLRSFVVGPERRRIVVDGMTIPDLENLPKFRTLPPPGKASTWFVCPKDKATLRVPEEKADQTFKCPVDGTTMEKRKGRGFTLFMDDDGFESNIL